MFIVSYYVFFVIYTLLFGLIFGVNADSFNHILFYILAVLAMIVSLVLSFCTNLFIIWFMGIIRKKNAVIDNKFNHRFGNSLLKLAHHILRIKLTVTGKENIPDSNFVLVGNHQENSDIIILKPIFKNHPLNFIAKEALFTVPILGRWITLLGNVPISKYADRSAAESIIKGIRLVKKGYPMAIFPEGKRSFSNKMIEFKPGAFKLAMKPKADILIVTLYNIADVKIKIPLRRQKVYVHINGLLKYEDYKDMNSSEIAVIVKETIQKQLDIFDELYEK
jgi:1-acyl-sn-glycerol-3-phosphate acyltransferase